MGLVNFIFTSAAKCLDAVCLLLDLNFLVVHTVVRTLLAVVAFINNLPSLLWSCVLHLGNLLLSGLLSAADGGSQLGSGAVALLCSMASALEGLLESLKMVGYLSMHFLLRGKEQLYRCLLWVLEGCGIALSLLLYFTNTIVNFALIATHNTYLATVGVWQAVSSPVHKLLELTLTSTTFLQSCLTRTSDLLWSPCKLLLDFLLSLVQIFISIFILNAYGLVLTVVIALTTTAYFNPGLARQAIARVVESVNSFPALRRCRLAVQRLATTFQGGSNLLRHCICRLHRTLCHLYLLQTGFWQQLLQHRSQLCQLLRTLLHRDGTNRARRSSGPGEGRRDPPDGRAGDEDHRELLDFAFPSSSIDSSLEKTLLSSSVMDGKTLPAESLLTLLKEQEERKKCVICQDRTKTVVLLPCRHLCLCSECTDILLRQPLYQQNCPLCRHMILNTMDVYL